MKQVLSSLFLLIALVASAQHRPVEFYSSEGELLDTWWVSPKAVLSFGSFKENLIISEAGADPVPALWLSDVDHFSFPAEFDGVETISQSSSADWILSPSPVGDSLSVSPAGEWPMITVSLRICDLQGRILAGRPDFRGGAISVAHLPAGKYILMINNQPYSFLKK